MYPVLVTIVVDVVSRWSTVSRTEGRPDVVSPLSLRRAPSPLPGKTVDTRISITVTTTESPPHDRPHPDSRKRHGMFVFTSESHSLLDKRRVTIVFPSWNHPRPDRPRHWWF